MSRKKVISSPFFVGLTYCRPMSTGISTEEYVFWPDEVSLHRGQAQLSLSVAGFSARLPFSIAGSSTKRSLSVQATLTSPLLVVSSRKVKRLASLGISSLGQYRAADVCCCWPASLAVILLCCVSVSESGSKSGFCRLCLLELELYIAAVRE